MNLIWVTDAKYVDGYKIDITFNDGVNKVVDLSNRLNGILFEPLKDINYLRISVLKVGLLNGVKS